jgi:hypothetical protein
MPYQSGFVPADFLALQQMTAARNSAFSDENGTGQWRQHARAKAMLADLINPRRVNSKQS